MARKTGVHPSTVLRQVRRYETRRDDPVIDEALCALARAVPVRTARRTDAAR